jgi:hypothetical protein
MSCPRRRCDGSGFQKPTDPALSAANDTALNALLAKRAEHDARLAGFWKAAGDPKPETKSSTPGADVVEVDGHHYRFDNPGNAEKVQEALAKLLADRGYQNAGVTSSGGTAVASHHYFAAAPATSGDPITHVGGGFRSAPISSVRPRAPETAGATGCCDRSDR